MLCSAPSVPQPVFTITEKALVGAFSVIVKTGCGTDGSFYNTNQDSYSEEADTVDTTQRIMFLTAGVIMVLAAPLLYLLYH